MPRRYQRREQRKTVVNNSWNEKLMSIIAPFAESVGEQEIKVGQRLREIRMKRGLSLRALGDISGLNFNTLSLIENEKSSPSVSTLQNLAVALRIPITAFFESIESPPEIVHQQSGKRPKARFRHGILEDLGGGLTLGEGLPLLISLAPGADSGPDAIVHSGQEFVYCLKGHLTYVVAGKQFALEEGDSLVFQAQLPHLWGNYSDTTSKSLMILCPTDEHDRSAEQHFANGLTEE